MSALQPWKIWTAVVVLLAALVVSIPNLFNRDTVAAWPDFLPKGQINLGLDLQDIVGQVRQGFFGAEAQRLQRGEDEVRVWVRYDEADRHSIADLERYRDDCLMAVQEAIRATKLKHGMDPDA